LEFRVVRTFTNSYLQVLEIADILWVANSTKRPLDLTTVVPDHNQNFLDSFLQTLCVALSCTSIAMAVVLILWTLLYRKHEAVKPAQPILMILIAVGVIFSLIATIPLTKDHNGIDPDLSVPVGTKGVYSELDGSCSSTLWLYIIGFDITYGALFAKLYRVKKIFLNPKIGQGPVKVQDMLLAVTLFLTLNLGVLMALQVDSPLYYRVNIVSETSWGYLTESRGGCTADSGVWMWLAMLIGVHGSLLVYGNLLTYQLRNVPSEFNEGKYVGFSLANNLQTTILALMLLFLVSENPTVAFITKFFEVYWSATVTLLMMFVPKVIAVHFVDEDSQDLIEANEMRKAAKTEATLARSTAAHRWAGAKNAAVVATEVRRPSRPFALFKHKSSGVRDSSWVPPGIKKLSCESTVADSSREPDSSPPPDTHRSDRRGSAKYLSLPRPRAASLQGGVHRKSIVVSADLNLNLLKAEMAALLSKDMIGCLKHEKPLREWLGMVTPRLELLPAGSLPEEQADSVAHLLVEGKHLRSLQTKARRTSIAAGVAPHEAVPTSAVAPEPTIVEARTSAEQTTAVEELKPPKQGEAELKLKEAELVLVDS